MSFDVNNQAHLAALRRALAMPRHERETRWFFGDERELNAEGGALRAALYVLRYKERTATIARDLFARAGVSTTVFGSMVEWRDLEERRRLNTSRGPLFYDASDDAERLISVLADLAPGDVAGALRVGREF